jgi:hypothetical protein
MIIWSSHHRRYCMMSTTEAIHITVDHGGWHMPACGLLGSHICIPLPQVSQVDPNDVCPMCLAAALPYERFPLEGTELLRRPTKSQPSTRPRP